MSLIHDKNALIQLLQSRKFETHLQRFGRDPNYAKVRATIDKALAAAVEAAETLNAFPVVAQGSETQPTHDQWGNERPPTPEKQGPKPHVPITQRYGSKAQSNMLNRAYPQDKS